MADNAISRLNTITQAAGKPAPQYVDEMCDSSPGNEFMCTVSACFDHSIVLVGTGYGPTKKAAKLAAAEGAISKIPRRPGPHAGHQLAHGRHPDRWAPGMPSTHSPPNFDCQDCARLNQIVSSLAERVAMLEMAADQTNVPTEVATPIPIRKALTTDLKAHPRSKAHEIATRVGTAKQMVNSELYTMKTARLAVDDEDHRWSLVV